MVDVRIKGRADLETTATVGAILPGGRKELPSPALGFPAGGETAVDSQSPGGDVPEENIFEIRLDLIRPDWPVLPGHIAVIRFHGVDKPLAVQAWRSLLQLLQRRFHV
ncbi:MAG: hypothetical protein LUG50_16515 [Planctomycetaceae bacterium]|nr:hypothetical protein [Planctomycetaceae bacterium]